MGTAKIHYVYKITRSDGYYYIGRHSTNNLEDEYFGSGSDLRRSINEHGKEFHSKEILEFLPDRKSVIRRERELVGESWKSDPACLNMKPGGDGNWTLTPEQYRARNSKCHDRFIEKLKNDVEFRDSFSEKMSRSYPNRSMTISEMNRKLNSIRNQKVHLGSKRSQESKDKMSVSGSGDKNSMFGKMWIFNERLKISKRIQREFASDLSDGWKIGRKMKFA